MRYKHKIVSVISRKPVFGELTQLEGGLFCPFCLFCLSLLILFFLMLIITLFLHLPSFLWIYLLLISTAYNSPSEQYSTKSIILCKLWVPGFSYLLPFLSCLGCFFCRLTAGLFQDFSALWLRDSLGLSSELGSLFPESHIFLFLTYSLVLV